LILFFCSICSRDENNECFQLINKSARFVEKSGRTHSSQNKDKITFVFTFVLFRDLSNKCMYTSVHGKSIPGHFFNIEHSPYLFPMFSFKKHRSMHVCNHVTKVTKISTRQFNKMVKLFEEEIHIKCSYSMPIGALEMCVTFPMQHMIDQFHQSEQFLTLFQNLWCSV
jgi:hypothetical protein